jgi:tRNA U34 5-methylaminomethyl-2-thiouridine-forming methyltransferase MnmC
LTCRESEKLNVDINYSALEAFPLDAELVSQLNYVELLRSETDSTAEIFSTIHSSEWERPTQLAKQFRLHKIRNTLQEIKFELKFDLIYFDAFGPRVQPGMWTEELFSKIYDSIIPGGILVTYCAKGEVKRTLKKVGYLVETLPGPPRKREMIRATKVV